jgi:hypothetical protein
VAGGVIAAAGRRLCEAHNTKLTFGRYLSSVSSKIPKPIPLRARTAIPAQRVAAVAANEKAPACAGAYEFDGASPHQRWAEYQSSMSLRT